MVKHSRWIVGEGSATAVATAWVGLLAFATWTAGRAAPGPAAYLTSTLVYAAGALVCHQESDRSFHYLGAQVPVCARCAGIYFGAFSASWVVLMVARRLSAARSPASSRLLVASCAMPTLVTLTIEWVTPITPSNTIRAAAGLPLGAAVAWVLARVGAARLSDEVH